MARPLYVYIMTNRSGTLYIGVTNSLVHRVWQHRHASEKRFCGRYRMDRLVFVEEVQNPNDAIRREKQLKGWTRRRKIALIESVNREWRDLMPRSS